jgi:hypothetical protein
MKIGVTIALMAGVSMHAQQVERADGNMVTGYVDNIAAATAEEYMVRQRARSGTAGDERAGDALGSRITILVYDYAGVQADTLLKSEQEASRIFRHSGIDITWRHCRRPGSSIPPECPPQGPMTPALRLVPRFRLVQDRVHAEAMGYATGDRLGEVRWYAGGIGRCTTPGDPGPHHSA